MGYIEQYNLITRNATIAASASEAFGQDIPSKEARYKHGSFNSAIVTIQEADGAIIRMDGRTDRVFEIKQPGTFKIKPEEGYFFDWITITDRSAAGITANTIDVKLAIAKEVK